jgi:hypothetical protein
MPSGYVMPYQMPAHSMRRRPSLGLRARVWLKSLDLDAQLAGGADPAKSPELRLRAEQLRDPRRRGKLAAEIDRLVVISDRGNRPGIITARAPFRPGQVRANRALLQRLAARLRDHRAHSLRGLAMTALLLEDARGPLSSDGRPSALERAASAALSALDAGREHIPAGADDPRPTVPASQGSA